MIYTGSLTSSGYTTFVTMAGQSVLVYLQELSFLWSMAGGELRWLILYYLIMALHTNSNSPVMYNLYREWILTLCPWSVLLPLENPSIWNKFLIMECYTDFAKSMDDLKPLSSLAICKGFQATVVERKSTRLLRSGKIMVEINSAKQSHQLLNLETVVNNLYISSLFPEHL